MKTQDEYFEVVRKIYDGLAEGETPFEKLIEVKSLFQKITDAATQTELFKASLIQHNEYLDEIRLLTPDPVNRCAAAWNYFDKKCDKAPTSVHLFACVILIIPAINQLLEEADALLKALESNPNT